ncbi:MAG TPA: phage holin family protein [Polyangiaceae bacterium]|jgi:uncharacterized membrane protein YqjE|nr:phage holin family protein [Polyangiaceae bacterium]
MASNADLDSLTTGQLIRDIADDVRLLIQKEAEAARVEIRGELAHLKRALILGGIALGGALLAAIGLMFALAQLLRTYTALSEWSAFAVVTALFAAIAIIAALIATRETKQVELVPHRTMREVKRDARLIERDVRS